MVAALTCATTASAQAVSQTEATTEPTREGNTDVVVTASRVASSGFDAPTPTTVVGAAELRQGTRPNIAAVLDDLPAFRPTLNPGNTGLSTIQSGVQSADLRGVGATRTLVLLNGHRFVGDNDLNTIPIDLVERVEVVTGGASADWGSGAVAGVVNVLLNDKLKGLTLSIHDGISDRGDGFEYRASGIFGTSFASDRGHLILDAEYYNNDGITPRTSRPNIGNAGVIANQGYTATNGQHQYLLVPNLSLVILSPGGLILSGPLAGQAFNPDGTLHTFNPGTQVGSALSVGGEQPYQDQYQYLTAPVTRYNLYGRTTFEVSNALKLSADVRYMRSFNDYPFFPDVDQADILIRPDNAFLSSAVRTAIAGKPFVIGRLNSDFAFREYKYSRQDIQGTVGASGDLGGSWKYDAYYTHGERTIQQEVFNARIKANFALAVDSVVSPTTGQPICRIALTNPATNCVPIDLFGVGAPSAAATAYVNGSAFLRYRQKLDNGAVTVRGEPFSLWAGPVAIAVGGELRRESIHTLGNDPISLANGFTTVNSKGYDGSFNAKEAFGEVAVPLLRDVPLLNKLDFNAAGRISDFSNSGTIYAWKLGATDRVFKDLLLRFVRSRDTRSASLTELFTMQTSATGTITDPVTRAQYVVTQLNGGNANLLPEKSNTTTFGGVYSPSWAPGLNVSVDHYDINIDRAITTLSAQDIVTRCATGNTSLCALITRGANGQITGIQSTFINLANYRTKGLDIEASYLLPLDRLWSGTEGRLRFRALANHVETLRTFDGVNEVQFKGTVGPQSTFGVPAWRGVGSVTYERGATSIDVRARYVDGGTYNPLLDIANNNVPSRTYFDLTYEIGVPAGGRLFTLFGSVTNLLDKDPPLAGNPQFYDIVGRYFTIGARVKL